MANGYCPALLRQISDINAGNFGGNKLHITGFLAMAFCCQNSTVSPVNDGNQSNGQQKALTVSYRKRPVAADVQSTDDCTINRIPAKLEWALPTMGFKSTSWFLGDDEIRKYCDDAAKMRSTGGLPTPIMQEHYDLFLEHASLLTSEINKALVTSMATKFGYNTTTGSSTGKVINISRLGDQVILDNGIIDMMRDIQENEICGSPCMVGGGLFSAWNIAQSLACCNAAGLDMSKTGVPNFYFDKNTQTIWGTNAVGLFAPGSLKFLGFNNYVGPYAGEKAGNFYATIPLPVNEFANCNMDDCLKQLVFDLQMRYIPCPTDFVVDGVTTSINRGWQFILSKRFALWVQPTDGYEASDELANTNGTLKYWFSNTAATGAAYGHY